MATLIYLHGFASGPEGHKGRHCRAWAERHGIAFLAPDLNVPDFEHLSLTAQVELAEGLIAGCPEPPVVVGSSLGGLVAAAAAMRGAAVRRLVLLAPAFGFARRRLVGPRWSGYRKRGTIPVFHHALARWVKLGPALLDDLAHWRDDAAWQVPVPVVILHGARDESVPVSESRAFSERHPGCRLHVLDDDHALLAEETLALLETVLAEAFGLRPTSRE
jgi:hypothetical protein